MNDDFTPAQKRRVRALTEQVDRVSQADRRFFERFPHRRHRVRLAHPAEREQFAILGEWPPPSEWPPGMRAFVAVRNVAPGRRIRLPFIGLNLDGDVDDCGEADARAVFEECASPEVRAFFARIQKALGGRSC